MKIPPTLSSQQATLIEQWRIGLREGDFDSTVFDYLIRFLNSTSLFFHPIAILSAIFPDFTWFQTLEPLNPEVLRDRTVQYLFEVRDPVQDQLQFQDEAIQSGLRFVVARPIQGISDRTMRFAFLLSFDEIEPDDTEPQGSLGHVLSIIDEAGFAYTLDEDVEPED